MKSKTINIAVLLAALFSLVSCLDTNDGDYVYTDDSAVTAFSVTSAKKAVHVRASNGADSVYYTTATLTAPRGSRTAASPPASALRPAQGSAPGAG